MGRTAHERNGKIVASISVSKDTIQYLNRLVDAYVSKDRSDAVEHIVNYLSEDLEFEKRLKQAEELQEKKKQFWKYKDDQKYKEFNAPP